MDYDGCVALERQTEEKYEWLDGHVYAMAGGTPAHGALSMAIGAELRALAIGCGCQVFSSDVKVRVQATGLTTYPDASVVCGDVVTDVMHRNVVTNPTLLVEVLSDRTEGYDRGDKFMHYQQMLSLQDYVLVSQHGRRIEVFCRDGEHQWTLRVAGARRSVPLSAMRGVIDVDRVYAGITLSPAPLRVVTRE